MIQLTVENVSQTLEAGYLPGGAIKWAVQRSLEKARDAEPSDILEISSAFNYPITKAVREYLKSQERTPEEQLEYAMRRFLYTTPHRVSVDTSRVIGLIPDQGNPNPKISSDKIPSLKILLREKIIEIDDDQNVTLSEDAHRKLTTEGDPCKTHIDRARKTMERIMALKPQGDNISWSKFTGRHRVLYKPLIDTFSALLSASGYPGIAAKISDYSAMVFIPSYSYKLLDLPTVYQKTFNLAARRSMNIDEESSEEYVSKACNKVLKRKGTLGNFRMKNGIQEAICFGNSDSEFVRASFRRSGTSLAKAFTSSIVDSTTLPINPSERTLLLAVSFSRYGMRMSFVEPGESLDATNFTYLDSVQYSNLCTEAMMDETRNLQNLWQNKD